MVWFLAAPCLPFFIVVACLTIPLGFQLAFCLMQALFTLLVVRRYAKLASPFAITRLIVNGDDVILEDRKGNVYSASPVNRHLIHPFVCLLSFKCFYRSSKALKPELTHSSNNFLSRFEAKLYPLVFRNNTRHIIICRYNVESLRAFRRIRVWFKLQAPHQQNRETVN